MLLVLFLLVTGAEAKRHRHRPFLKKFFPATHDSVRLENERADALSLSRVSDERELSRLVERDVFMPLDGLVVSGKLPPNRRYALPQTVDFIRSLDGEFYETFGVRLVVDSAIRPATTQKRLLRWNRNAAPANGSRASTHERGTTVDISRRLSKEQYLWLVWRLAYYRELGRVLVIEEKACFHIFVGGVNEIKTETQEENSALDNSTLHRAGEQF